MARIAPLSFVLSSFVRATTALAETTPQIALSKDVVEPGGAVTITVTGTPGEFAAILGSSVNSAGKFAGVPLNVGRDRVVVLEARWTSAGRPASAWCRRLSARCRTAIPS